MVRPPVQFINMITKPAPVKEKQLDLPTVHQPLLNNLRAALICPTAYGSPVKDRINNRIDHPSPIPRSQVEKAALVKINVDQSRIPVGWMPHLSEAALLEQERELRRTNEPHPDRFCRNVLLMVMGMVGIIFYQLLKTYINRESDNGPRVLS